MTSAAEQIAAWKDPDARWAAGRADHPCGEIELDLLGGRDPGEPLAALPLDAPAGGALSTITMSMTFGCVMTAR